MRAITTGTDDLEPSARVREFTRSWPYEGDADSSRRIAVASAQFVNQVDALVRAGVLTERDRRDTERTLMAFAAAGTDHGTAQDERIVLAAIRPAPATTDHRRAAVLEILRDRTWRPETARMLGQIDRRFAPLTPDAFDAHKTDRSVHRFAARLSCQYNAFGDRQVDRAMAAFEQAAWDSEWDRIAPPIRFERTTLALGKLLSRQPGPA